MTTLPLSAVGGFWWKSNVTLSANHFLDFVLSGQCCESGFDFNLTHTTASESENEMESGLLLNIVIRESSAVFELLASEDKSLLVWRNTFFILDLSPVNEKR